MSSEGVVESADCAKNANNLKIDAPFCTICHVALPPSIQLRSLTPETSAANNRAVDFFIIPELP